MDHPHDHSMHHHAEAQQEHLQEKGMHAHETALEHEAPHEHGEMHAHDHAGMINDFRRRFWVCLILSLPVIFISPMIQRIFGYTLHLSFSQYISFGLSSVIFFYGGWPFLKGLADELKARAPGMMTLIGLAISVAYVYSTATVFGLSGMDFYWELATLITIMLLGHWIEMKSIAGASRALELLVSMLPNEAHLLVNGQVQDVKIERLQKGNIILIRPGEKVPADGLIREGESELDESMLTGESTPDAKKPGDKIIGGSINGNGSLQAEVVHTGKESYLNKVINLVQEAQKSKSQTQALADRAAKWLTYIALFTGFGTLAVWLLLGARFDFALERMVTVMVISCPHALGLAVPLVVAISTSVSARNGLLIRNRTAFENARKISTIIFDKTGTLTKGSHEVSRVVSFTADFPEKEMLRLAASLEQNSEHYISKGILKKTHEEGITFPPSKSFHYLPGKGTEGVVEGKDVKVVGPNYLKEFNIHIPPQQQVNEAGTVVYMLINKQLTGAFVLKDQVRPESAGAIKILKENHIKNLLLTGDNENVAESVSKELGMDGYMANVLPHEKLEKVKELQQKGEFVAMTGDGVNDAPALAQADVGIAVGSGTDVAAETADIILVNSNPEDIKNLILFGKATYRKMIQNLVWATAYNVVAIPLAAGVLYKTGFLLSPAIGALFMSLSTVIVALNAQLLRRQLK